MTRADLEPGVQACQAVHAAICFALSHPHTCADRPLALLAAGDEQGLAWLCQDALDAGIRVVRFHEPDLSNALTAAAFEPSAGRLLRHLPPALTGRREVNND